MILEDLGYHLNEEQKTKFATYYKLLITYNEKMNLTAITQEEEVYLKHFYDSLLLDKMVSLTNQSLLDIGSGAGFPSIPLKIIYPELKITIVDALNKRIIFLKQLCEALDIEVNLVHARAEEYVYENRESFDIVCARAVAKLNVLAELCIPYVKVNGFFIALKGKNALDELEDATSAIKILGAEVTEVKKYYLQDNNNERYLIKIQKKQKTLQKYPRIYGKIKRRPL